MSQDQSPAAPVAAHDPVISEVSAWVLRIGVILSSVVMLGGLIVSFIHGAVSIQRMTTDGFDYQPAKIIAGILNCRGKSIIEAGIYILLFTPILRVAASTILFAFQEKDRVYTLITFVVLILTLAGLLWIV
jgi:uncharacterized membrane protein